MWPGRRTLVPDMPHEVSLQVDSHCYLASDDRSLLDMAVVHGYLTRSYWSPGISKELVERAAANSMAFGVYEVAAGAPGAQVGFGRVISDASTYAYLSDIFVLETHRGAGLSKLLVRCMMTHPELQGLRRWMLMTRDAHGLYEQFGFAAMPHPERAMEIVVKDPYRRNPDGAMPG